MSSGVRLLGQGHVMHSYAALTDFTLADLVLHLPAYLSVQATHLVTLAHTCSLGWG